MTTKKIWFYSSLHAIGVALYIAAVAGFFRLAETFSAHNVPEYFAPVIFLLLFVISATVTGFLVFGKPAMLYLGGYKKEAGLFLAATIIYMVVILALIIAGILLV